MSTTTEVPLIAASPYDLRVSLGENVPENDMRVALESGDVGFMHSFTTGSAVDGPGVRVVGWMAGCQFRCLYCHNPDTWKMTNGMPVPVERAVEQLKKYRHELQTMKGGVTISGGEPLMQHRFVLKVFAAAKQLGVHTALDSNGYLGDRLTEQDFSVIDLVLLDLKAMTPDLHKRLTGQDNAPVHAFAKRLAAAKKSIWVRFVLVPGWTDDMAEVERIAKFAASLGNVERVDVLPFHQMGRFKWEKLKMEYKLNDIQPPPRETVEAAITRFRAVGLKAY
ncbi:MAG TPA: pyruvate formate-lyase-activating protein [Candidatus Didemnitutus sp.]|nr:pyruvate formate-lyase-activating protein [Candidatus Didemnitutus sp.]